VAYTFKLATDDLLTEAWERLGLNPEGLTDAQARSALRSLQFVLIDWTNADLDLWQVERISGTLAAGDGSVTTPAGTIDVLEVCVASAVSGGTDMLLAPIGRAEWMALPDKTQTGRPTLYWVERIQATPELHLWPVPDAAYPVQYSRLRLPADTATLAATPDTPVQWQEALVAGLAAKLAVKWAADRFPLLKAAADEAWTKATREGRERVPFRLLPRLSGR
jgi:hypothetical protein